MDPHAIFNADHAALKSQAAALRAQVSAEAPTVMASLSDFQKSVQKHFKREDSYYRILDDGKRVADREMIHQLRNDHAAVIFTLESLVIRLRKNGNTTDWRIRFNTLMSVFLPHLEQEDTHLFPIGKKILTPDEIQTISQHIKDCD